MEALKLTTDADAAADPVGQAGSGGRRSSGVEGMLGHGQARQASQEQRGRKVMSYLDAERWLTRAESVGRQRALEEVIEALAQRKAAVGRSWGSEEPAEQSPEGHARQLTVTVLDGLLTGAPPPPSN